MLTDHKMQSYARALHQACIQEPKAPEWERLDGCRVFFFFYF